MTKVSENDMKCGPHLTYENGSCIPINLLKKMVTAYNDYNLKNEYNDNIIIYNNKNDDEYKEYLIEQFNKKLGYKQKNWIDQNFINNLDNETKDILKYNTFRPDGPQGQFDWLSTIDINLVLAQYENKYNDFKFLGAVPIDFMSLEYLPFKNLNFKDIEDNGFKQLGVIFNLDESYKSGSHWVSLYCNLDKCQIYFSDSYGIKPESRIQELIEKISFYLENKLTLDQDQNEDQNEEDKNLFNKNLKQKYNKKISIDNRYNKTQHQKGNSECGVYSINFILRLLKGKSFDYITQKRLKDDKINKCRSVYFGNSKL